MVTMPFEQEAPLARRAGCVKAGDGLAVTIQNPQVAIDLEAAVRDHDPALCRTECIEGSLPQRRFNSGRGPVVLVNRARQRVFLNAERAGQTPDGVCFVIDVAT